MTATLKAPPAVDPLDHQGLVWTIAIANRGRGVEVDDLVQEGQLGLLRACELFDASLGYQFSTYAVHWVKNFIQRAIQEQAGLVRIPVYMQEKISKGKTPDSPGLTVKQRQALAAAIRLRTTKIARIADLEARDMSLADLAVEREAHTPDPEELHQVIRAIVTLPRPMRRVLRLRFGLTGHEPMVLREIAERFGVTRERIRQIEGEAIAELKKRLEAA